ncbi:hypothetical protein [Aequorivita vladivostokensis]|uniref:Gliding motility-associated protein GldM N-terminal domain-containing protein n=1 Tax=Aequorivita vladivostokensis TaxID=171194 RepID=A0ABR5DGC9_9FLAO|nr:hypothetical protein [Aequorivita vladivostokensis]KJJ37839.1 hypothetical protein MB09_12465 [Aequorivita vladivostokensis]MBF31195.1 hypothetical protein [Aequorivita sp.]HBL78955.1 hypothetical protein [Aequorivita sp.]|tara:strand:- start:34978 stop:35703 length:726 start_codon:yes stop_codon:yes gene_type:complete
MSSKSEVGHNKNVANYKAAYTILEEMGSLYNPTNTQILLTNLEPLRTTLTGQIDQLDASLAEYRADVADRKNAIALMDKKATKINQYFHSLDVPENEKQNIAAQVKLIRGDSKKKTTPPPNEEEENHISTSRQSFDNKVANFNTLIAQLEQFSEYAPNEDEIKLPTLRSYTEALETLNERVHVSGDGLITARAARNNSLYYGTPNVLALIKNIKAYVRSLGLAGEPYYKALVRLKFSKPVK